jgi:hypothetical protein
MKNRIKLNKIQSKQNLHNNKYDKKSINKRKKKKKKNHFDGYDLRGIHI